MFVVIRVLVLRFVLVLGFVFVVIRVLVLRFVLVTFFVFVCIRMIMIVRLKTAALAHLKLRQTMRIHQLDFFCIGAKGRQRLFQKRLQFMADPEHHLGVL